MRATTTVLHACLVCTFGIGLLVGASRPTADFHVAHTIFITLQRNMGGEKPLPVVLWHGMGDSCCASFSIGAIKSEIEKTLGVYVHSIATGSNIATDTFSSFFGNVNDQVAKVCAELRAIPELQDGFNAVGFSQGGQFLRGVVERCQHTMPPMKTLVTLGAQHQGIMTIPGCISPPPGGNDPSWACRTMQHLLSEGAYLPWVRDHVVQAQYFKDPYHLPAYTELNPFLPDINNERKTKRPQYAANLASLDRLVLIRFRDDETVVPRDSAWFSLYNGSALVPLREQALYREDWIGLKQLDDKGGLVMGEVAGMHMQFTLEWFRESVIEKYLS